MVGGQAIDLASVGMALTEDQLRLMWRISDEPVISLDGDTAGIRAALRVIDLALPLLEAGKGLRFAVLPAGLDPDDLIRAQGAGAMQKVLDGAQPMVNLLWNRETEGRVFDSPERKAALDKTLRAALMRITDPSIRSHYGEDIKRLRAELFGTRAPARTPFVPGQRRGTKGALPDQPPVASTKGSLLATGGDRLDEVLREAARRMPGCVRATDTVGRIGGDEFVVLLLDVDGDERVIAVAEKIRHALNEPILVGDLRLAIASSIGIAIAPQHGSSDIELARNADLAMYRAKEDGRNKVCLYSASMQAVEPLADAVRRLGGRDPASTRAALHGQGRERARR